MPQKLPTLHDVAKRAGVSYQTVSRVVNSHPNVSQHTRSKVIQAIRDLGYRPNLAAKILATGRSHTLQLLSYDLDYHDPLPAMVRQARERGYTLIVSELGKSPTLPEMKDMLGNVSAHLIDGIILLSPFPNLLRANLKAMAHGIPIVVVGTSLGSLDLPSVVFDQRKGAELALYHLISLGHRRVAEIRGPVSQIYPSGAHFDACIRHIVWEEMTQRGDLLPAPSVEGDFTMASGYRAAHLLMTRPEPYTAIFIGNDRMAFGAIRAFREHGYSIPRDISIIGYDDMDEAAYYEPPLTTVRQDLNQLGRECIAYLISLIDNPSETTFQRVLSPELVVRQSAIAVPV